MTIRQTKTNNSATGEAYFSHRLVRSQRMNGKIRQVTLLNLGRLFPPKREDWPLLCARIEQLIEGVVDLLPIECLVKLERVAQRIVGQLVQHYQVELITDEAGKKVTAVHWEKQLVEGSRATDPSVYCLRTNELAWDAETLWHTYVMLTDLESVFRSLKSELGLRPVFHSTENRVDGHLFITVLAYQFIQVIRTQLKQAGIQGSWTQIRKILGVQQRVTSSLNRQE